jgi:hypothetical protein
MDFLTWLIPTNPIGLALFILQLVCIYGVISRRHEIWWILVILVLPFFGIILYISRYGFPSLRAPDLSGVADALKSPSARIADLKRELEERDTVELRLELARAYKSAGQLEDAVREIESTKKGIYKDDAHITYELADARFEQGQYELARELVKQALENAPGELRGKARLLLARTLEKLEHDAEAEEIFKSVSPLASGEEGRYRYAEFLVARGRKDEAVKLIADLQKSYNRSAPIYRRQQRQWFDLAQKLERQIKV